MQLKISLKSGKYIPYLLLFFTGISLLSADVYLPAMPMIAKYFDISSAQMQSSVTVFFIGTILSVLTFGYCSDLYGRKPLIILSIIFLLLGSASCAYGYRYEIFLGGRILQGVGAGGISILGYAIIQDCLNTKNSSKLISILGIILVFVPTLSPILGGFLMELEGWQCIFIILTMLSMFVLIAAIVVLPETLSNPKKTLNFKLLTEEVKTLFFYPKFIKTLSIYPISSIGYWVFITESSFIYSNIYKLNISTYKYLISIPIIMFSIGCFISQAITKYYDLNNIIKLGSAIAMLGALITSVMAFNDSYYFFIIGNGLFIFAVGIIYGPSTSLALSLNNKSKGLTASIRSAFVMTASLMGALLAQVSSEKFYIVNFFMLAIAIFVFFLAKDIKNSINQVLILKNQD